MIKAQIRLVIPPRANLRYPYLKGPESKRPAFVATGFADQSVDSNNAKVPDFAERGFLLSGAKDLFTRLSGRFSTPKGPGASLVF